MFSKIIVNSPWYFFLLSILLSLVISLALYFKNKKNSEVSKRIIIVMFALRFLSLTIIIIFLLSIFLKQLKNETQNPLIIVAFDNSSSMVAQKDSLFIKNNFQNKIADFKKAISKSHEVKTILFGSTTSSSYNKPTFSEKETDISNLLVDIENNYSNQNVGAVILLSDGIYNKGANPIYASEKISFPIYSVAFGDTNEVKDISINKINHNQVAYLGNIFPVEAVVSAKNYRGNEIEVKLFQNQVEKAKQIIKITSDNFLTNCNFSVNASTTGISKYVIKTSILKGEKNILNNQQSFAIDVIDNKEKILILAQAPHPDIAAIKESISKNISYELEYGLIEEFKKPLKQYSLIILHGLISNQNAVITECKTNNIPFWLVNPNSANNLPEIKINSSINKFNDAEVVINNSFGLFTISDELKKFTKELPAIKTFFGNYTTSNNSNTLIKQKIGVIETENPVLVFSEINNLKSGVFIGDGLWKWKMRDYSEHLNHNLFNELISKTIQYLSIKSDKSLFRITCPKTINENQTLEISAEVYNKSYELITDQDVTLTLINSEGKKFNYTFSKTSDAFNLNLGILPAGEYKYEAKTKIDNQLLSKQGNILIKEIASEKINTVANHQVLNLLSKKTGGKLFYSEQLDLLEKEVLTNEQIKPITYSQNTTTLLIDLKWLFWLVIGLLAAEWLFRKRYISI